jgi:hypothetical protein
MLSHGTHSCHILSSLSSLQHLFFGHSQAGDLRPYLCGYFDTSSGLKGEEGSYHNIQLTLGVDDPSEVRCCCCCTCGCCHGCCVACAYHTEALMAARHSIWFVVLRFIVLQYSDAPMYAVD